MSLGPMTWTSFHQVVYQTKANCSRFRLFCARGPGPKTLHWDPSDRLCFAITEFCSKGRPLISANRDRRNKYKEVKTIRDTADHIHKVEIVPSRAKTYAICWHTFSMSRWRSSISIWYLKCQYQVIGVSNDGKKLRHAQPPTNPPTTRGVQFTHRGYLWAQSNACKELIRLLGV